MANSMRIMSFKAKTGNGKQVLTRNLYNLFKMVVILYFLVRS